MQDGPHVRESALNSPDVIVITGMSGAGRTEAMHTFEDLGYYVIDNLPPSLILSVAQMSGLSSGVGRHLAVVCDLRSQGLFEELDSALEELADHEYTYGVLFLDASDDVLLSRYALNRRPHPIAREGESTLDAIRREREQLAAMRERATLTIDTTNLKPKQLRSRLLAEFTHLTEQQLMEVHVFSFGFKYGMPEEADIIIDVRFLPNPYWDPEMRPLTGRDPLVRDFVIDHPQTQAFLERWYAPARHRDARLRGRGQEPPVGGHRLLGRPASLGGHCRGHGRAPHPRGLSRGHEPSRPRARRAALLGPPCRSPPRSKTSSRAWRAPVRSARTRSSPPSPASVAPCPSTARGATRSASRPRPAPSRAP